MMYEDGVSLRFLSAEIGEMRKDYIAFSRAYDILKNRLLESNETATRSPLLHEWSGSRAVAGSLELSIHAIERTIQELDFIIQKVKSGEIPNTDKPERPTLGVVDGGK